MFRRPNVAHVVLAVSLFWLASLAPFPEAIAEPKKLDPAALGQMLSNLGYKPSEHKWSSGNPYFTIKGKTAKLNWSIDFTFSNDLEILWATLDYRQLKEGQKIPYEVLLETLAKNDGLEIMHFVYLKGPQKLRLAGSVLNRDLAPADLRKIIDEAVRISEQTEHLWNPDKWRAGSPPKE